MKYPIFASAAMLAAVCLAAAAPVRAQKGIEIHSQYLALQENGIAHIDAGQLPGLPAGAMPGIYGMPQNGTLTLNGLVATYTPLLGFTGNDSFTLVSGQRQWVLEVRVLPQILPVAGRFRGPEQSAGLFDNGNRSFLLCSTLVSVEQTLDCDWRQVPDPDLKAPLIPVAWPDPIARRDLPALFDLETGELQVFRETGSLLEVELKTSLIGAQGGWPILGDWRGNGNLDVAIVFGDGRVMSRSNGFKWHVWPGRLPLPDPSWLTWPILLPVEAERSALALVHPHQLGALVWMALDSTGQGTISGVLGQVTGGDLRRPLSWVTAPEPGVEAAPYTFFLRKTLEGGLGLFLANYGILDPSTIPVKFPDDPPGPRPAPLQPGSSSGSAERP